MSAVEVRVPIFGTSGPLVDMCFAMSTADEFERGVLTITSETGNILQTFQAQEWGCAIVYGDGGYPLFQITNELYNSEARAGATRGPSTTDRVGGGHPC